MSSANVFDDEFSERHQLPNATFAHGAAQIFMFNMRYLTYLGKDCNKKTQFIIRPNSKTKNTQAHEIKLRR
jgi:hypothetical protein